MLVQLLDNVLGWYTDGRDEKLTARLDDSINQSVQLALGVIVARS